jgi:hypothetical protein
MVAELRGSVPKISISFCPTLINRAWRQIRENYLWSFQIFESAWASPPPVMTGGCTFTQGSANIQFNPAAVAAINASVLANPYAPITVQQIRAGSVAGLSGIYNILTYNQTTGAATLDRLYMDFGQVNGSFTIYQAYYFPQNVDGSPMTDFKTLLSVRNMQMFVFMNLRKTREWLDSRDPQRSWYQFPTHVVPWGRDARGAGTQNQSASFGSMLFELWGTPITPFTYQVYGLRKGMPLVNPADTLPFGIGEDMVLAKAKWYAYQWAEANKDMEPRSKGPDYRFLMGQTDDEYTKLLRLYRREDREAIDNYFHDIGPEGSSMLLGYYNTIAGVAGPYANS